MHLTGPEYVELETALVDAHTDRDDLASMLRRNGWEIKRISGSTRLPDVVRDVIEHAETRDLVHELVAAARASNPTNVSLLKVSAAIGLDPRAPSARDAPPAAALEQASDHFERMVDARRGIADLGTFAAKLQELMHQVCAVELDEEFGTGFLIGPDTVLTNYHVVEPVLLGKFDATDVRLKFDYQKLRDGSETNLGVPYELADHWLVHGERYSAVDNVPYDEAGKLPAEHELDYAVLRTRKKVGLLAPSGPIESPRGWITPRKPAYKFQAGTFLMIIQHPCHDPISFDEAQDAVIRLNRNKTRVHYRTNTMPGSSGSPVLNRNLELVALHHAGEPGSPNKFLPCKARVTPAKYNAGIPIERIERHLAEKRLGWVFESESPPRA